MAGEELKKLGLGLGLGLGPLPMNTEGCWGFAFSTLTAKCDRCSCRSGNGHAAPVEPPARGLPHLVDERPVANPVVNSTRHTTFIHARWTNLSLPKRRPNQTARGRRLPGPNQALTAGQFKVQQASPLQMHRRRRRLADDDDEAVESLKTETETGQVAPRRLMPETQTPRRRRRIASCKQGNLHGAGTSPTVCICRT